MQLSGHQLQPSDCLMQVVCVGLQQPGDVAGVEGDDAGVRGEAQ